jgi:CheY-like chemotaxis protein
MSHAMAWRRLDYLHRRGSLCRSPGRTCQCFVLLDLKMPKLDGIDVLRHMKSDPDAQEDPRS